MSTKTVEKIVENLIESRLLRDELLVNWHAGEPLVLGPKFYEEMISILDTLSSEQVAVEHSLQTNGMLITPQFCDLFQSLRIRIGVSIDGPAFLHDRYRRTRTGRPTHEAAMKGVALLQERGIPFNVICVVTEQSLDHADEIYDFFFSHDMRSVALNLDELEGSNVATSMSSDNYSVRFARFMERLYNRCERDKRVVLREFHEMEEAICSRTPRKNSHTAPFVNLTIDSRGGYTTYSPELLGHYHDAYGSLTLGNVHDGLIRDSADTPIFRRMHSDIANGVEECARRCNYYSVCGGGCPSNKLFENGSFASAETLHCRNRVWTTADLVLSRLEEGRRHFEAAG